MNLANDFLDLMARGGPVMWVIFVTAWIAIVMLIERTLRIKEWSRKAIAQQREFESTHNGINAIALASQQSPIAMLLARISWDDVKTESDFVKQLNIHLAELMPKLEGTLPTVAIIGTLLPMLGLLGTVTGMIDVFQVIALHGTGNPQEMAHGISQALLTTASGLIIAIPVIFAHHLLVRRLRYLMAVTEQGIHLVQQRGFETVKRGMTHD